MRGRLTHQVVLAILLLCQFSISIATETADPNDSSKYLDAVRTFADNVLKYGRDTYGPKHTPLFVDGLNIHTHEPVKWISPKGDVLTATETEEWILSNLASQQNLFRTLDGLTKITGDPKYKQAAMEAIEYAFENLRSPNGLLHWGGHQAYDASADKPRGRWIHELKAFYPYYELMWEVDPQATKQFIEAFWSGHILDWSNLDMDRHAKINQAFNKAWNYEYKGEPVFWGGKGFGPLSTGSDLFYAAAWLNKLSGDKKPLVWSKRLAHRYVETRNPKTGISQLQFNKKVAPDINVFPHPNFSNPIFWQNARYYRMPTPEMIISPVTREWLCQCLLGEMLNSEGGNFIKWAHEELTAIGNMSYRKEDNTYVPISSDGTSKEGYICEKDGLFGPKGSRLKSIPARQSDFWAYSAAYRLTGDAFMWDIARSIAAGNEYGDIGEGPAEKPQLECEVVSPDTYALLGFMELHRKTKNKTFLKMAQHIADKILTDRFQKGFFEASNQHIFCKFDTIDPLALLHLHFVICKHTKTPIPEVWPNTSFFDMAYRNKEELIDNKIYTLTEYPLPLSLQEAAAIGDLDATKSLIEKGANVNGQEDTYHKTSLHRAAISGHKQVADLLLSEGAQVDATDSWNATALHYAAENGHEELAALLVAKGAQINLKTIESNTPLHYAARSRNAGKKVVELLITNGADLNTKNNNGQAPVDIALSRRRKEVVEMLTAKGADVSSIHLAAYLGDIAKVMNFIEQGIDVNAKNQREFTPLHYSAMAGSKEVSELLLARGADIKAKHRNGSTSLHWCSMEGHRNLAEFLITEGADINAKDASGETALHWAANSGQMAVVELLIAKGADIHIKDKTGHTPLYWAVDKGHRDVAELLIVKGADINAKTYKGETAISLANRKGHAEIVELLRKHGAKE